MYVSSYLGTKFQDLIFVGYNRDCNNRSEFDCTQFNYNPRKEQKDNNATLNYFVLV